MRDAAADEAQGKIPKVCATYIDEFNFPCYLSSVALFLDRGLQGLFHVIVCSILTVKLYYFPRIHICGITHFMLIGKQNKYKIFNYINEFI